ncbi:MAG: Flagellar hook-associated protein 1 [Pseudomonadota bacterium]|jgi:flagellar hook-associated protein FlgK
MSDLLGISSSAVSTYQRSLAVISNNIANAATEGYSRQDISTQASPTRAMGNNYLGTGVFFDGIKRQYDSFVDSNLRNSSSDLQSQKPVVDYTNRVIDVMGGQTSGLTSALDQFFSSARSLAADPASTVLRGSFLRDAEGIASRFSQLSAQLDLVDAETKESVESNVNQINALSQQLARVNTQLGRVQSVSKQPPELLDQRDSILLSMSEFAKVNTRFELNGVVTVGLGATSDQEVIVSGREAHLLGVSFDAADPEKFRLVLDPYGNNTPVMGINSGELAGLMAFREQVLGSTRSSLDALAQTMAKEINDLHQSGVDAYGQTGKALFDFDPAMAHASAGLRITTKDPLNIAAAAAFRVIENASNTGTADAMVRYQAPAFAGAAALDQVLVNNSNAVAGAKLNVAANPGALPVSYIPAGMRNTTIYLDTLNEGQNLQILTRDGRHLVGQTLGDELQDRIMTEASGMELNATYSNSLLNIEDDSGYRKMPVFYGARAQAVAIQQFDSQGNAITPQYETPVLSSGRISNNWSGLPAEKCLNLNGVQLGALTPSNGTSVQAKDVAAWVNNANVPGVRAVAENKIEVPASQLRLRETLSLNNIAITFPTGGYNSTQELADAINNQSSATHVKATLGAQGELILNNATGHTGEDILVSGSSGLTPNALGLNGGNFTGQVRLERTDGTVKTIGLSIGAEGSAADLQRLGFRAAAYIDGPAADDLLVFVSGAGAAQIAASYTTENLDAKEKLRNNPMTLKFVTATRFTLTDQKTGTLLAEREFNSALPDASISFQGLNLTFSKPPQLGDSFVLDGNRDGTGNNENMLEIVALESKPVMGNGKTLGSAYIDHVNDMGNVSRQASIVQSALTVVHDQAVASRDAVSGVSLDEEATNLIRFQQAYQASAKVMQVASQLFDSVLQIR